MGMNPLLNSSVSQASIAASVPKVEAKLYRAAGANEFYRVTEKSLEEFMKEHDKIVGRIK